MIYGASTIKRRARRTKTEIERIRETIYNVLEEQNPASVRGVFYQVETRGVVPKTDQGYRTVQRLTVAMRREGVLPYGWIADGTRWMRRPRAYSNMEQALEETANYYRRRVWDDLETYAEVWCEKEALAGVIYQETAKWDVPLMITRGYPSLSYLYEAAEQLKEQNKPCFLYYLGDFDPSGVDIPRKVEEDLRQFAPEVELYFSTIAVTARQIDQYDLPTRPTKKTDTRSKGFGDESVEVDAIPPNELRAIIRKKLDEHVPADVLQRTKSIERAERETLATIVERFKEESTE